MKTETKTDRRNTRECRRQSFRSTTKATFLLRSAEDKVKKKKIKSFRWEKILFLSELYAFGKKSENFSSPRNSKISFQRRIEFPSNEQNAAATKALCVRFRKSLSVNWVWVKSQLNLSSLIHEKTRSIESRENLSATLTIFTASTVHRAESMNFIFHPKNNDRTSTC